LITQGPMLAVGKRQLRWIQKSHQVFIREPKSVVHKDVFTKTLQNNLYILHRILTNIFLIINRRIYNNKHYNLYL
jgi:hypothetical protein